MHLGGPNSTHNSSILNSQHECQFCSYSPDWFLASRGVGVNHAQPQEAGAAPVSAWDVALGRKAETRLCVWGAVYAHALLQWPSELQKTQSLG